MIDFQELHTCFEAGFAPVHVLYSQHCFLNSPGRADTSSLPVMCRRKLLVTRSSACGLTVIWHITPMSLTIWQPSTSMITGPGVMFQKDVVAPGRMRRKIRKPRVLLLDCPLEYKKGENQTNVELTREEDWRALSTCPLDT